MRELLFCKMKKSFIFTNVLFIIGILILTGCNAKGSPSFSNTKNGKNTGDIDIYSYVSPNVGDILIYRNREKAPYGSLRWVWYLYKYDFRYDKKLKKKVFIGDGYRILDINENGSGDDANPVIATSMKIDKENNKFKAYFDKEYGRGYKIEDELNNNIKIGTAFSVVRVVSSDYINGGSIRPNTNATIIGIFKDKVFPEIDKQKKVDAFYVKVQFGNQEYYSWFAKGFGYMEILGANDDKGDELVQQLIYRKTTDDDYGKKPVWFENVMKQIDEQK